jgi:hypothetical protein
MKTVDLEISKYRMMRIKMKISYQASINRISILELFITAMKKTYRELRKEDIANERFIVRDEILEGEDVSDLKIIYNLLRKEVAIGTVFGKHFYGYSKLQVMRAKLRYRRIRLEMFLHHSWYFGVSPNHKVPKELMLRSYPHSFRYYDPSVLIFLHYINLRANRTLSSDELMEIIRNAKSL